MMFSDKTTLASIVLGAMTLSAHAQDLDLSYQAQALPEAQATTTAEPSTSKFHLEFKAPISVEHSCSGPQCAYETDVSQLHEPQTVNRWQVGFN